MVSHFFTHHFESALKALRTSKKPRKQRCFYSAKLETEAQKTIFFNTGISNLKPLH